MFVDFIERYLNSWPDRGDGSIEVSAADCAGYDNYRFSIDLLPQTAQLGFAIANCLPDFGFDIVLAWSTANRALR